MSFHGMGASSVPSLENSGRALLVRGGGGGRLELWLAQATYCKGCCGERFMTDFSSFQESVFV